MWRFFLIVIFICAAVPGALARDDVELNVKPSLCIVDRRTTSCRMELELDWRSESEGDYCLRKDRKSLRCWEGQRLGGYTESVFVSESLEYSMHDLQTSQTCATAVVDVLRMDNTDRRRSRRSRHVWDLL